MAKINKVSERVKEAIKRKSAFGLPDRPSERGMKPEDIKRAFWQPVVDMSFSAIAEIDRVVDEINEAINESSRAMTSHTENKDNPHKVTKDQVGLGKVNNTADAEKPVSAAQREAIAEAKEQFSNELQTEKSRATLEEGRLGDQITQETERAQAAEEREKTRAEGVESGLDARVKTIEGEIPTDASVDNKLATQSFTNSSINNLAAFYITYNADNASFPSKAALTGATTFYNDKKPRIPTTNDYAIVRADESQPKGVDGSYPTTRYVYQGGTYPAGSWSFQWVINNTSLTQAQIDALNSGITAAGVAQIEKNKQTAQNAIPKSEKGVAGGVATLDGSGQVPNSNLNNAWLLQGGTEIGANDDLNAYTTEGNYYCASNDIAKTLINCPTTNAFTLKIYSSVGRKSQYVTQEVHDFIRFQIYTRLFVGSEWYEWIKLTVSPNEFIPTTGGVIQGSLEMTDTVKARVFESSYSGYIQVVLTDGTVFGITGKGGEIYNLSSRFVKKGGDIIDGNLDVNGILSENGQRVYSPNNLPNRAQTENSNEFNPFYNNASSNKYAWFNYRGSGTQAEMVNLGDGGGEGRYGVWKAKDYLFSDGVSVLEKVDQKINEAITTALNTAV